MHWTRSGRAAARALRARRQASVRACRRPARADREAREDPDRPRPRDPHLKPRARPELCAAQRTADRHLGAVAADLQALAAERAAAATAAQPHRRSGPRPADPELEEDRVRGEEAEGRGDGRDEHRERRRASAAVLVDAVAGDVARAGMDARIGVVAVLRALEAVAVAVQVDGVGAAAVLVDPVLGDVDGARVDGGVAVVAVGGLVRPVAVDVGDAAQSSAHALAVHEGVDRVGLADIGLRAAVDGLRQPVAREQRVRAGPPTNVSTPPRPSSRSSPAPPSSRFGASLPVTTSLPAPAATSSMSACTLSSSPAAPSLRTSSSEIVCAAASE